MGQKNFMAIISALLGAQELVLSGSCLLLQRSCFLNWDITSFWFAVVYSISSEGI